MEKYNIYAGLRGGFGGASYCFTTEAKYDDAMQMANRIAIEMYEGYEGFYGILDWAECAVELEINPETEDQSEIQAVTEFYNNEIQTWIDYYVIPTDEDDISEEDLKYE